jgi:hypothetical protein
MNDDDRQNLQFIMSVDKETLYDWWHNIDDDDREYAKELLQRYKFELEIKSSIYACENVITTFEAKKALEKFML